MHRGNDDTRPLTRQRLADLKPNASAATGYDANLFRKTLVNRSSSGYQAPHNI
jgi:hypothetical protein